MVIFHSYVKLPEGTLKCGLFHTFISQLASIIPIAGFGMDLDGLGLLYQPYFSWFNPVLQICWWNPHVSRLNKEVTATLCFAFIESLFLVDSQFVATKIASLAGWILVWSDKNIFKLVWYFCVLKLSFLSFCIASSSSGCSRSPFQ